MFCTVPIIRGDDRPRPFDGQTLSSLFCLMNLVEFVSAQQNVNSGHIDLTVMKVTKQHIHLEVKTYIPLSEIAKNRFFVMINERSIFSAAKINKLGYTMLHNFDVRWLL